MAFFATGHITVSRWICDVTLMMIVVTAVMKLIVVSEYTLLPVFLAQNVFNWKSWNACQLELR